MATASTISCPACLTGHIKSGTPSGTVSTIHGLQTYVATPTGQPKGLIVMVSDIFGWELSNPRLLADTYAEEGGFLVYLPDFMAGNSPPASTMHAMDSLLAPSGILTTVFLKPYYLLRVIAAAIPFFVKNKDPIVKPRIYEFHRAVKSDAATSALKLGSAGYCWGGKYTILLSQEADMIDAAFTAHPSKMKFPDEWLKVQKPLSVAIGDVDLGIKIEMVRGIKDVLEKEEGGRNEVVIYEGAKHGFAVRADPKDEGQTRSAVEAKGQAIKWFEKWLA
ncbi:hypothetical protein B7494_g6475 [Chlorociboria aeruginascens]|nr:hypothetical protein B7494_g6475 [Chlorociboria aeruginascens]